MEKEKFYEMFGHPSQQKEVKKWAEPKLFREIVFVKVISNKMLNMRRASLPDEYKIKVGEIWSRTTTEELERVEKEQKEIIEEALEKTKLAKEMIKRNVEVKAKVHLCEQRTIDGDIHCWKVYVEFLIPVDAVAVYYGMKFKQKVFIFVPDGVYEQKHPGYRIKEEASPTGWLGMDFNDKEITTCY